MHITGKIPRIEPAQQSGYQVEVGPINQLTVRFERVRAISDAVENGSRLHRFEHRIQVGIDKQVGDQDVLARQALESPGGKPGRCPINILTVFHERAQQVGADKPTRPQY